MSEDLIRRSDAIKAMEKLIEAEGTMDYTEWDFPTSYKQERINQTEACIDQIRYIPAVEPERGEWLEWIDCEGEVFWKCSACGQASEASAAGILYKFCPFCGVRMKGADDE